MRTARDDRGFTLIETMTSLALLGVTLAAMGPFFIGSFQSVAHQRSSQAAVQLADSAIEQVRALKGSSLLTGRGQLRSTAQWNAAPAVLDPYLDTMQLAWDPLITSATSTLGDDAAISTAPQTMTIEGTAYTRTIYLGICDVYVGGTGACVSPALVAPPADSTKDLKFFRAVVLVTWVSRNCPAAGCSYVVSTLVARASEPIFDFHRPAPLIKTLAATFSKGTTVDNFTMEAAGGQLPNTWTTTSMPPGLLLNATGVITGTPAAAGTYPCMVTVRDTLGRSDTQTVTFTVVLPPALTAPAGAQNHVGEPSGLQLSGTGGAAPYVYSATGLPPGLTLNAATGAISGTVTTIGTYAVTATVTDSAGGTASKSYTHRVFPALVIAPIAGQAITLGQTIAVTAAGSGGNGTYSYAATGLPAGVLINPATGVLGGLPTVPGRYLPVVTVTDGLGGTASAGFVVVISTTTSLIFTSPAWTAADQTSTAGTPATVTFQTNGSTLGLSPALTVSGLPPGMTMNPLTGTISGTPTKAGSYPVTVLATNALPPATSSYTFLWTVK